MEAEGEGSSKKGAKHLKKAQKRVRELEAYIDSEFEVLSDTYDREELETLRWNYRLDQMEDYKLTEEELRYFLAVKEAEEVGAVPPMLPASLGGEALAQPSPEAHGAAEGEYQRKSNVDMALVDKYLERHIERDSTAEMSKIYKEAFGEELHVPEKLSLVDLTYGTGSIGAAGKVTKAEIFGTPKEAGAAKVEEKGVEATPAVKKVSKSVKFATAYKRGVPEGPGTGEKYRMSNPLRVWTIKKRFAGKSVGRYYFLFVVNLVLFVVLLLPRVIIWPILFVVRLIKRFVAPKVSARIAPRIQSLQSKLADPSKAATEKPADQG